MGSVAPVPWNTPVIQLDPQTSKPLPGFTMGKDFGNWMFTSLVQQIANAPTVYPSVTLTAQSASIGTTPIPLPSLATGTYRVTTYARITTADAVSSSLTITITWTDGAIACSLSGAAMTGNTTSTVQSNTALVQIDAATPISYSVTYASNTPAAMKYKLIVLVEAV
jgi:hypothetical protein